MTWIQFQHQITYSDGTPIYPIPQSPYTNPSPKDSLNPSSGTRISPAVLFIIVILAVLFFVSGILHLLVRFLIRHSSNSIPSRSNRYPEISETDDERQLQQLFYLHDSGLDQAFIDALPVFHFKEILGPKEQLDCAVCLCEFCIKDKLRLLPGCGHAFHINCIDTWLLSNSTCPLCRSTLYASGDPIQNPVFDFDDTVEEHEFHSEKAVESKKKVENCVFPVKLGKFRKLCDEETAGGETSTSNLDARRCYSMGSYEYIVRSENLRVALYLDKSVGDVEILDGIEENDASCSVDVDCGELEGVKSGFVTKGDSFSVSKIWQWPKKDKFENPNDV